MGCASSSPAQMPSVRGDRDPRPSRPSGHGPIKQHQAPISQQLPPPPPPPPLPIVEESPRGGYGLSFAEQYRLGDTLGAGTFSIVKEGIHRPTGQRYAVKCIKKDGLSDDELEALTTEIAVLKLMKHPNIMILHDFFSEEEHYFLVTEYIEGGELFDRIVEKSYYSEREARDLVKLLLEAVKYCHDCNVVHRDLKPENLLLTSKTDDASIKLADFGFAKRADVPLTTACGTPGYVAPEVLESKPYGKPVDIWSIGVITYILLCGYPPFHDDNHHALFRKIKKGAFEFDSPYWDAVSDDAKHFINQMLVVDVSKRATAVQLLEHPWISGSQVSTVQLSSALEELRRFTARSKFQAAVKKIIDLERAKKHEP
ncbi:hypothetical protein Ae201684P_009725 [Aphanomyces euteiches]|uniref:non-specific serine/threonine protein kinase n=1 Tax=Aphanomyces euteiches TaxID=100861 RepID=A0A6G0WCD9_9STRA|nr:hypothetical protein Ae201684_016376 [Aphanomyces euteiches]KAH9082400.1 hypothetical protein Ae201684P_009725 [Aphanomyces euteiches]